MFFYIIHFSRIKPLLILINCEFHCNRSHPLECTFFDNWPDMFNDINDNRESLGHVAIILQLAKVKYWNGMVLQYTTFVHQ